MPDHRSTQTLPAPTIVSLMWPDGVRPQSHIETTWGQDLGLEELAHAFRSEGRYIPFIRQTLSTLNTDAGVIGWRQAVLSDFRANPRMVEAVNELLPRLASLRHNTAPLGGKKRSILLETADRLAELDTYVQVVLQLEALLRAVTLHSDGMRQLRENIQAITRDASFQKLRTELPELQRPLQRFSSLTIGINLDPQLLPTSAVLLSINEHTFGEARSFIGRLLGSPSDETLETGIAPLHLTPTNPEYRPLSALFQDLERLITQSAQPIARALNRYARVHSAPLLSLENELAFYAAAVGWIRRLEARGAVFCQPEVAPQEDRLSDVEGLVNVHLLMRDGESDQLPISNPLKLDDDGRIAILTGPNSGGKTTYLRAVGLAQALFQAGLFIPAQKARLSPVDAIFTHFPALESQQGRLSEEAARLRQICLNATRFSLVLMNESLSSTTASEASYLAQDVVCGLRAIGVRAVYATHLVELAEHINDFEHLVEGPSRVFSLVAGVQLLDEGGDIHARPTFQIQRGAPQGRGYAREIARRHGISLEQILEARRSGGRS